jgi:hypothetical protein
MPKARWPGLSREALAERRTLGGDGTRGEIRQADKPDAPLVAELDKWVALNLSRLLRPAGPRCGTKTVRRVISARPRSGAYENYIAGRRRLGYGAGYRLRRQA